MTFTQDFFRFERLGFQCNPFRALTTEEWQAIAVLAPAVLEHLSSDAHLQIMGEMGRGKTTTLMGILAYYSGQDVGYEYIAEGQHRFKTKPLPAIFLLDEAQRLWVWEKRRLLQSFAYPYPPTPFPFAKGQGESTSSRDTIYRVRARGRLIFTTHADLSGWFRRYDLPLITLSVEAMTQTQLAELLARRLDYFRTQASTLAFTEDGVAFLATTFGDNRRAMERFLYEVLQTLPLPQALDSPLLAETYKKLDGL